MIHIPDATPFEFALVVRGRRRDLKLRQVERRPDPKPPEGWGQGEGRSDSQLRHCEPKAKQARAVAPIL